MFTHLFYIPIMLASFWWGRKGVAVAALLAGLLIFTHLVSRSNVVAYNDYLRSLMFVVVSLAVAALSERNAGREQALRTSERRFRELADNIPDAFFVMDSDFRYTYWNAASERNTGISGKDALGKSLHEIFPDVI